MNTSLLVTVPRARAYHEEDMAAAADWLHWIPQSWNSVRWMFILRLVSLFHSRALANWTKLPTFRVVLPILINLIQNILHRHTHKICLQSNFRTYQVDNLYKPSPYYLLSIDVDGKVKITKILGDNIRVNIHDLGWKKSS